MIKIYGLSNMNNKLQTIKKDFFISGDCYFSKINLRLFYNGNIPSYDQNKSYSLDTDTPFFICEINCIDYFSHFVGSSMISVVKILVEDKILYLHLNQLYFAEWFIKL